ncbi:hypothetical protein WICPIJ_007485 [Wickerhamomyces pijperi]|uniref:Uncharacterized protein n=1 Tax=Wickerhamomyces pijperi TaxID=599730 RepID=A0A9P8Q2G5_WICPI|nr:hypothetical protein WICPIJ_007485 [Wickerhamomyces pijperi]
MEIGLRTLRFLPLRMLMEIGGTAPEALPKETIVPFLAVELKEISQVSLPTESKEAWTPLPLVYSKTLAVMSSETELIKNSAPLDLAKANFSGVEAVAMTWAPNLVIN